MEVIWKRHPRIWYVEISNTGLVRTIERCFERVDGVTYRKPQKYLTITKKNNGYCYCQFWVEGKKETHTIHKLVMETFVGERPEDCEINHIDSNPTNNNLNNLEYLDAKEHRSLSKKPHKRKPRGKVTYFEALPHEVLKDIPGYEGVFKVTNLGRVISFSSSKPIVRKPVWKKNGYATVCLNKDGKIKLFYVHKLIYSTFNNKDYAEINVTHVNGDKKANYLLNLKEVVNLTIREQIEILKK